MAIILESTAIAHFHHYKVILGSTGLDDGQAKEEKNAPFIAGKWL